MEEAVPEGRGTGHAAGKAKISVARAFFDFPPANPRPGDVLIV